METDGNWSIEHIHAQDSKEMKDPKATRKWLEDTYAAIKEIKEIEKESKGEDLLEVKSNLNIEKYKTKIINLLSEEKIDEDLFNQLKAN